MRKLTHEEFIVRVGAEKLKEYQVLSEYRGMGEKILLKHSRCQRHFEMRADKLIQGKGKGCPYCFVTYRRFTTQEFKKQVNKLVGIEYQVIGEYVKSDIKVKMKHARCGLHFDMTPNDFKGGKRCPHCYGNHKKTTEQFKNEVFDLVGNEYLVVSEYINTNTYISIKHNVCGYTWGIRPYHFLRGRRCPKCAQNLKKTTIQFKKEVLGIVGEEYSVLESYKGARLKILLRHNSKICDYNEFEMTPTDFLGGKRCPKCYIILNRGPSHPNYKPSLTDEDRKKRDYLRGLIRVWGNRVFRKDNYTCLKCGQTGGDLNAHHINSWDTHKDERLKVKNGATLCKKCHSDFHKIYGYGDNTTKQFGEYIKFAK